MGRGSIRAEWTRPRWPGPTLAETRLVRCSRPESRVGSVSGVPERTSPVPLGDVEALGALVGLSFPSGGGVGCGPGAEGRGVLPGGGVAPCVGVGPAVGRGVGAAVGRGVGARGWRRRGCRRRGGWRQRHGDGRSNERIGLRARGDRCVEGHRQGADGKRRGAYPRPGVRVAAREGERDRGAPELGPDGRGVPHRVRRVVVDTEGEDGRRRAAAGADVAVGEDRVSACRRRHERQGAGKQHSAKDP